MGAKGVLGTVAAYIAIYSEINPSPTALNARILNLYSAPSFKSDTVGLVENSVVTSKSSTRS